MKKPLISIIIPVYNCEKYIKDSIQSALLQTYKEKEIIIINDGSNDKTFDILKNYNNHITIIHKNNGGTASALNTGIKASHGDFIKWLSADDILYPTALENMVERLTPDYENCIYYTHYEYMDAESQPCAGSCMEPNRNDWTTQQMKDFLIEQQYYGNGSTSLIHKNVFKKIGMFDESLPYFEDLEFWIRAVSSGVRLHLMETSTLKYRLWDGQLTKHVDMALNKVIRAKYKDVPNIKHMVLSGEGV